MLPRARLLAGAGYGVLLVDLQAHGESQGERVTAGWRERHGVAAALEWLQERDPGRPRVVLGVSMGGAAAVLSRADADAFVLESVYPDLGDAIERRVGLFLGPLAPPASRLLTGYLALRLDIDPLDVSPEAAIARIRAPVLMLAGDRDRRTPPEHTRRLFDAAPGPKRLVWFAGAAHQDLLQFDPRRYREALLAFLSTVR
jgi:fermentation-respiration switch protein FrsA (DUF1100 family)